MSSDQDLEIDWKMLKRNVLIDEVNDKIITKHKKMPNRAILVGSTTIAYRNKQNLLDAIKSYQLELLESLIYKLGEELSGSKHVISRGNICLHQKTLTFR